MRRSRLLSCVLRGSENEADGGDRNGGGNGRGVLFAKSDNPVSNLKGQRSFCKVGVRASAAAVEETDAANSGRHLGMLWISDRRGCGNIARATCGRRTDLLIPAL